MDKKTLEFVSKIPGWLSIHEGQFLAKSTRLVKRLKGKIVEIGSFQGKSTIWLVQSGEKVYSIDPHLGKLDVKKQVVPTLQLFQKNLKKVNLLDQSIAVVKTSQEAVKDWKSKIKLLFIDGLHDYRNASVDFHLWNSYLVDGGIIAMHDAFCGWEGVQKVALEKIVFGSQFYEVGVAGSIIYGIKGKGNWLTMINRQRCRLLIILANNANRQKWIPKHISFILIHRLIKLFLINRFTGRRS